MVLNGGLVRGLHFTHIFVEAIGLVVKGTSQGDLTDDLWQVVGYIYITHLELRGKDKALDVVVSLFLCVYLVQEVSCIIILLAVLVNDYL